MYNQVWIHFPGSMVRCDVVTGVRQKDCVMSRSFILIRDVNLEGETLQGWRCWCHREAQRVRGFPARRLNGGLDVQDLFPIHLPDNQQRMHHKVRIGPARKLTLMGMSSCSPPTISCVNVEMSTEKFSDCFLTRRPSLGCRMTWNVIVRFEVWLTSLVTTCNSSFEIGVEEPEQRKHYLQLLPLFFWQINDHEVCVLTSNVFC